MQVEVGTRVEANWGAMFPTQEGTVTRVDHNLVTIEWDFELFENGNEHITHRNSIQAGGRRPHESPIGIFMVN